MGAGDDVGLRVVLDQLFESGDRFGDLAGGLQRLAGPVPCLRRGGSVIVPLGHVGEGLHGGGMVTLAEEVVPPFQLESGKGFVGLPVAFFERRDVSVRSRDVVASQAGENDARFTVLPVRVGLRRFCELSVLLDGVGVVAGIEEEIRDFPGGSHSRRRLLGRAEICRGRLEGSLTLRDRAEQGVRLPGLLAGALPRKEFKQTRLCLHRMSGLMLGPCQSEQQGRAHPRFVQGILLLLPDEVPVDRDGFVGIARGSQRFGEPRPRLRPRRGVSKLSGEAAVEGDGLSRVLALHLPHSRQDLCRVRSLRRSGKVDPAPGKRRVHLPRLAKEQSRTVGCFGG